MSTIKLEKGDWVRLKPGLIAGKRYSKIILFGPMIFSDIRQIEKVKEPHFYGDIPTYLIGDYYYTAEMLEIVARDSYNDPLLLSAMEALGEFNQYPYLCNSTMIASKEKDIRVLSIVKNKYSESPESSSLDLVVNKHKKHLVLNFKD